MADVIKFFCPDISVCTEDDECENVARLPFVGIVDDEKILSFVYCFDKLSSLVVVVAPDVVIVVFIMGLMFNGSLWNVEFDLFIATDDKLLNDDNWGEDNSFEMDFMGVVVVIIEVLAMVYEKLLTGTEETIVEDLFISNELKKIKDKM